MNFYIPKPIKIEAVKLTKENADEVLAWINSIQPSHLQAYISCQWHSIVIPLDNVDMLCKIGDYVIKKDTNTSCFTVMTAFAFESTYEKLKLTEIQVGDRVMLKSGKNKGDTGTVVFINAYDYKATVKWDSRKSSGVAIYTLLKYKN
jgi:hypothetical protein